MKVSFSPSEPGRYSMYLHYEDFRRETKKVGLLERFENREKRQEWRLLWNLKRIGACAACGCTNRWAWGSCEDDFRTKRGAVAWAQKHLAEIEPSKAVAPWPATCQPEAI